MPYPSVAARARFYKAFSRRYWRESGTADARRLPPVRRAADILSGFHPLEADWYRQLRGDTRGCTRNIDREEGLRRVNRHYGYVLDDKAVFTALAARKRVPVPALAARAVGGRWHWEEGGEACLRASLSEHGRFVVKPTLGKKGQEIAILETLGALDPAPAFDAIATPFVRQHAYAEAIFPGALNTVRVLMLRDAGGVFAAAATHRFGSAASGVTDNFSRNGVVAKVDAETGLLGRGLSIGPGNALVPRDAHPDTHQPITGIQVPRWQDVLALVQTLGRAFPELIYVGWDIAVTPSGPVVIEGNSHPSLRFFQFYDRILEEPRTAAFFADYLPVGARAAR